MTVVLSLMCADGVVMAADTQITEKDRGMSYPGRKLHPLGDHAAWGGSGARAVQIDLQKIFDDSAAAILESDDVAREIQERVIPVLKHHYDHFIPDVPGEESSGGPSAYVLAGGYSHGKPFIVEVNPNGMVSRYDDIGWHAVGSGAPMAQQAGALLAHFDMTKRSVKHGVVAAVRVIDALARTSPSVGAEFNLYRITPEGAEELSEEDIAQARDEARRWQELEQEALDTLFS